MNEFHIEKSDRLTMDLKNPSLLNPINMRKIFADIIREDEIRVNEILA